MSPLSARPDGPAQRFAALLGGSHPAATFFAARLAGFALLAGLAVLLGLFVTDVLVRDLGLGAADQATIEAIVAERTTFLTDVATVGAFTGGAPLLPVLVGLVALVLPAFVAASRMYKGMHHPLDVAGGVLIGLGAIAVLLFACRAADAAAHAPARSRARRSTARVQAAS